MWRSCADFTYRGDAYHLPDYDIHDVTMDVRRAGRIVARTGAWKVSPTGRSFDVRRLRLAVQCPLPVHIEQESGIRRNRAFPLDDARAYEYETPDDRARAANDARWFSTTPGEPWVTVRYPDLERDDSTVTFPTYEMNRVTGKVRRVSTQATISVTRNNTMNLAFDGKQKMLSWQVAYMYTFRLECRHADQTEVNRIDGDATNNNATNFRWASSSEAKLYQWRRKEPRHARVPFTGDPSTLREFKGWRFSHDGIVVTPQGTVRTFKVHRTAPYPVVLIEGERYRVHRIVAHLYLGLTLRELTDPVTSDRVVLHTPQDDTTNFRVDNLRVGTQHENMCGVKRARHTLEESANTPSIGDHALVVARAWISGGMTMSVGEALIALPSAAASNMPILMALIAMFRPHVDDPATRVEFAKGIVASSGLVPPRCQEESAPMLVPSCVEPAPFAIQLP
jgi:hypothetical protein